jgi:transcriptional regulator with GAF, ATPase, and Fis domain
MSGLKQMISKVAPTEATVLICGENGTGKELVANELFRRSNRTSQPFIRVNCAAVSDTLIESEFFGHEKGSFTGALQKREGRFELANGGTILLDEISEISPRLQAKLLRVLQEREFERVGGNKTIKVNVRVIATTNRDLRKSVERGEFREDLYYRLNVFPLNVPALRTRSDDVLTLAQYFLERFSRKHGVKVSGITKNAATLLLSHSWPGNVRELQNTIERGVILSEGGAPLRAEILGLLSAPNSPVNPQSPGSSEVPPFVPDRVPVEFDSQPVVVDSHENNGVVADALPLEEIEKQHILAVLDQSAGNRTQAATVLGISPRTLRNKIAQYRKQGMSIAGDD